MESTLLEHNPIAPVQLTRSDLGSRRPASDSKPVGTGQPTTYPIPSTGRYACVFLGCLLVCYLVPQGATILLVAAAVWALRSPWSGLQALTVAWLVTFLNPGAFGRADQAEALRWIVLAAAFVSVLMHHVARQVTVPRSVAAVGLFCGVASISSLLKSQYLDVSLFKLATFFVGGVTVLLAFHASRASSEARDRFFSALYAVVVWASLPMALISTGYFVNERGFQGVLSHPQAYAVFLAPNIAWLATKLLTRESRSAGTAIMFIAGCGSLLLTQARTGLLAVSLSLACGVLVGLVSRSRAGFRLHRVVLRPGIILALLAIGTFALAAHDRLTGYAAAFIRKGHIESTLAQSFAGSRGFLIDRSLQNVVREPMLGIGFGMPSDGTNFEIRRDPLLGLPVSASVEKGILPVAVLEEIGIVGAAATLILLVALLRPTFRSASPAPLCLVLAALFVNIGESVFFSMGGMGLYTWLLIGHGRQSR